MKISSNIKEKAEALMLRSDKTLSTHLGIEFLELSTELVVARMPVDERTKQPFGILHGGASVALAETVASVAARLNVDEDKFTVVGLEINANHLRAMRQGWVRGAATPIHRGRRTQVWAIEITAESDGKPVCTSRCTLANIELGTI